MLIDDCVTVDELKWLLKEEGEGIFESCDICPKNMATSYTVSLALFLYACSDSALGFVVMCLPI